MSDAAFRRYLLAKRSVDDRALNRLVWRRLAAEVAAEIAPLRLLEIGAGIGTMVERLIAWRLLERATLTITDPEADNLAAARLRVGQWAGRHGLTLAEAAAGWQRLSDGRRRYALDYRVAGLDELAAAPAAPAWDLLLAHAVLDLLPLTTAVPATVALVRPGGLLYLTINFDGGTLFEPTIDRAFDDLIEQRYHRTMDERLTAGRPSGDSRTGRHLFTQLRAAGATPLAAGSSDWVVFAIDGRYPDDEAYFLHYIVTTVGAALADDPQVNPTRLRSWVERRLAQIERGELIYIAHQLDLLARRDRPAD